MKRFFSLILLFIFLVFSQSCSKDKEMIQESNDRVAGVYQCYSALWEGGSIDVNGDGFSGIDFLDEFRNSSVGLIVEFGGEVSAADVINHSYAITFKAPLQVLRRNTETEEVDIVQKDAFLNEYSESIQ